MPTSRRGDSERGESLLELLVGVTILAVAVAALGTGIAVSTKVSGIHRSQSTAGAYVRGYADAVQERASAAYVGCATGYATPGFAVPAGFTASIVSVRYWNGSDFTASCGTDQGLQLVTVRVADNRTSEELAVVVRRP